MKKRLLFLSALLVTMVTGVQSQPFSGGSGTEADPYKLANATDMNNMTKQLSYYGGSYRSDLFEGVYFKLTGDIDYSTEANFYNTDMMAFKGVLDGNNKTIKSFTINGGNGGLFRYVGGNAIIKNLTFDETCILNVIQTSGAVCQILQDNATIENCTFAGKIIMTPVSTWTGTREAFVGGIAGKLDNGNQCVKNCNFTGEISCTDVSPNCSFQYIGGIVGHQNGGTIMGCTFDGTITLENPIYKNIGGITGQGYYLENNISKGTMKIASEQCGCISGLFSAWEGVNNTYDLDNFKYFYKGKRIPISQYDLMGSVTCNIPLSQLQGSGDSEDPIQISSARDMFVLLSHINSIDNETGGSILSGKYVKLTADIDFADEPNLLFGNFNNIMFFDGDGHTIKNLHATIGNGSYDQKCLLFYYNYGTIKNLSIDNSCSMTVSNDEANQVSFYGSIANVNYGLIKNCSSAATISDTRTVEKSYDIGGIAGHMSKGDDATSIENCTFSGSLYGNIIIVGGIVGSIENVVIVKDCIFKGSIHSTFSNSNIACHIGGIIGHSLYYQPSIQNCFSSGTITIDDANQRCVGAIIGYLAYDYCISEDQPCIYDAKTAIVKVGTTELSGGARAIGTAQAGVAKDNKYAFGNPIDILFPGTTWRTGYFSHSFDLPEGVKAYIVTEVDAEQGKVYVEEKEHIYANVAMLLERTNTQETTFYAPLNTTITDQTIRTDCANWSRKFNGSYIDDYAVNRYLILYNDEFVHLSYSGSMPAGACRIDLGEYGTVYHSRFVIVKGDATGISRECNEKSGMYVDAPEFFTLGGKQIPVPTKPGLYIQNGNKIIIK